MNGRPRILVVASRLPYPLHGGDRIRNFMLHQALSSWCDIDLVCPATQPLQRQAEEFLRRAFRNIYAIPVSQSRFAYNAVRGFLSDRPLQVALYDFPQIARWIDRQWREYDVSLFQHIRTAPYADIVGNRKIVDLVDAISLNYTRALEHSIGVWGPVYRLELPRLRKFEVACLADFDRAFIVSDVDRKFLASLGADTSRIDVIPVGVSDDVFSRTATNASEENWIIFLARLATAPNSDAAEYFANKIFPLVRGHCDAKLLIVGSSPPRRIANLQRLSGVEVRSNVPDPYEYFRKAKVVIAPLRFGAGMQNKVLEAMALGKAVVTTSLGASGNCGVSGKHYMVADTPDRIAGAIIKLWQDDDLRAGIGASARRLVQDNYSSKVIGEMYWKSIYATL